MELTKKQPERINEDVLSVGETSAGTRASALGALGLVIGPMTLGPCLRVPWGMCCHQEDASFQAEQSPLGPRKGRAI